MTGDMSLTSCGGFPPFARITGKFGNVGGNLGMFEANPSVRASIAGIRSDPVWFRNLLNGSGQPTETPSIHASLKAHKLLKWGAFGLYPLNSAATWGWHGQYSLAQFDWLQYSSPVRQRGWSGGINVHTVNQVIRRRTGTTLATCSYYQCKRNTNSPIKRGSVWIVGHDGTDPALLPEYWQPLAVAPADSLAVNTFVVGSFFDSVNNSLIGDWKARFEMPAGVLFTISQTHLTGFRVCSIDRMEIGDAVAEISNGMNPPQPESGAVPFPLWLRAAVVAKFQAGAWTFGNPYGYVIHGSDSTKLPAGFFVIEDGARLYRVKDETPFPPALAPSALPALFDEQNVGEINKLNAQGVPYDAKISMDSLDDRLMPSVQIVSVGINQNTGTIGQVSYNRRIEYARLEARTQFISLYGYEDGLSSVVQTKLENPGQWIADQSSKEGIYEVLESYDLSCGDSFRFSPATLPVHPLRDPAVAAIGGSRIGHCRLYFEVPYRDAPRASGPKPGSVEWISAIPTFARPGDWIEVEWWTWHGRDSFGAMGFSTKYKQTGLPDGVTGWVEFSGNQYELERVDHLFFLTPIHFPCPAGQASNYIFTPNQSNQYGTTDITAVCQSNHAWARVYIDGTFPLQYQPSPRWTPLPGVAWQVHQVVDTRDMNQARHCVYPNRPHSFIRNIKSAGNEQVIDYAPTAIAGSSTQQAKTFHMKWCNLTMKRSDRPDLYTATNSINPGVVVRHKLNLLESSECS